ncbi:MAG TPA: hypothetical protein VK838_02795 [Candidatus Limnocylindrales bacterium]|nr:hypothetical protein [Candidatus Limnocylindrales bacterium]
MNWYPWLVLAHLLGAFGFILAHGVSALVAFKLRSEREPGRVGALLDLSSYSLTLLYVSLLVLLAAGIAGGFVGDHWGSLWIWASIGVLVVLVAAMYALASPYYNRLRRGVGMKVYGDPKDAPLPDPLPADELAVLLASSRPLLVSAIGASGLVLIIGLMVLKPF